MSHSQTDSTGVYLETERLILRRFTAADADLLIELDSDPDVMRYLAGGKPTPPEQIRDEFLPRLLGHYAKSPGYGYLAAHEKDGGAFIGWFALQPTPQDPDDQPELGYRLRRAAWGRGYAVREITRSHSAWSASLAAISGSGSRTARARSA